MKRWDANALRKLARKVDAAPPMRGWMGKDWSDMFGWVLAACPSMLLGDYLSLVLRLERLLGYEDEMTTVRGCSLIERKLLVMCLLFAAEMMGDGNG